MYKKIFPLIFALVCILTLATKAEAHVTVKPSEAKVGQYQNFTLSVPNEKTIATTSLRLEIPDGLQSVRPNVKPGWKIEIKKQGDGEEAKVTEIIWTSGVIPPDQRDEFIFSAKVPSQATILNWKAYQTYQDGTLVSWDQPPQSNSDNDSSNNGPYSSTKIINDLISPTPAQTNTAPSGKNTEWFSYLAVILSAVSLAFSLRKPKQ